MPFDPIESGTEPLFRLAGAAMDDPSIEAWFGEGGDSSRQLVAPWFERIRACGNDVRVLLHDGCPTACVGDAAFAYANAFRFHAAIGFFHGAALPDPSSLLEGKGRRMRHVKLRPDEPADAAALTALIAAAYRDISARLGGDG